MGFNNLRKGREPGRGAAQASAGGVGMLTAFIDQGSEFSGKLSFKDTVRIDGCFEGEIVSENTLTVGETGRVQASIESEVVIISGEVRGDIHARRQLTLHKTARVYGNVRTASLSVEEGSYYCGHIKMGEEKPTAVKPEKLEAKPKVERPDGHVAAGKPDAKRAKLQEAPLR